MIFRLSQKLNAKVKAGTLLALPLDENPFADWSANLFVAGRTQFILLSNTKSLYSTVIPGQGITNESRFTELAFSGVQQLIEGDGYKSIYRKFVAPFRNEVRFAKSLDRAVIGSMNELIFQATFMLADGESPSLEFCTNLNDLLLSAIAPTKSAKYGKPKEAFEAMVNDIKK